MLPFVLLDINWGAVGLQAGQLVLALSILVILHEFGHFLPAKIFGCRVEKFFLFFDPWFSLAKKENRGYIIWHWLVTAWRICENIWHDR